MNDYEILSGRKAIINDTTNIKTIQRIFTSYYLNLCSMKYTSFFNEIIKEDENIIYNFTLLCLEWFLKLSSCKYYDGRNENSVIFSRKTKDLINERNLKYKKISKKSNKILDKTMTIGYQNHLDIFKLIKNYLIISDGNNEEFISGVIYEHKTIQQNLSRFCVHWFEYLATVNTNSRKEYIKLIKRILDIPHQFPYI